MNYRPIPFVHNRDVVLELYACYKQQHASDKTTRVNGNGPTPYLYASALQ